VLASAGHAAHGSSDHVRSTPEPARTGVDDFKAAAEIDDGARGSGKTDIRTESRQSPHAGMYMKT
jgi:hypothetical protein